MNADSDGVQKGTPANARRIERTNSVFIALADGVTTAAEVVARWESGDLAEAVRDLAAWAKEANALVTKVRAEAAKPMDRTALVNPHHDDAVKAQALVREWLTKCLHAGDAAALDPDALGQLADDIAWVLTERRDRTYALVMEIDHVHVFSRIDAVGQTLCICGTAGPLLFGKP